MINPFWWVGLGVGIFLVVILIGGWLADRWEARQARRSTHKLSAEYTAMYRNMPLASPDATIEPYYIVSVDKNSEK